MAYCLPFLVLGKNEIMNYDDKSSPIYNAMTSEGNKLSLHVIVGMCIPLTIDYILDLLYFGSMDKDSGYKHRGILLLNAWIPNLLILFLLFQLKHPFSLPYFSKSALLSQFFACFLI